MDMHNSLRKLEDSCPQGHIVSTVLMIYYNWMTLRRVAPLQGFEGFVGSRRLHVCVSCIGFVHAILRAGMYRVASYLE